MIRLLVNILKMAAKKKVVKKVVEKVASAPRFTILTKIIDNVRGTTTMKREHTDKV